MAKRKSETFAERVAKTAITEEMALVMRAKKAGAFEDRRRLTRAEERRKALEDA